MSDQRLRELERAWREHGTPEREGAWLRERIRAGLLARERVELAAWCGHPGARAALEAAAARAPERVALREWTAPLERWGAEALQRAALAAFEVARAAVERRRVRDFRAQTRGLTHDPRSETAERAHARREAEVVQDQLGHLRLASQAVRAWLERRAPGALADCRWLLEGARGHEHEASRAWCALLLACAVAPPEEVAPLAARLFEQLDRLRRSRAMCAAIELELIAWALGARQLEDPALKPPPRAP